MLGCIQPRIVRGGRRPPGRRRLRRTFTRSFRPAVFGSVAYAYAFSLRTTGPKKSPGGRGLRRDGGLAEPLDQPVRASRVQLHLVLLQSEKGPFSSQRSRSARQEADRSPALAKALLKPFFAAIKSYLWRRFRLSIGADIPPPHIREEVGVLAKDAHVRRERKEGRREDRSPARQWASESELITE